MEGLVAVAEVALPKDLSTPTYIMKQRFGLPP